MDCIIMWMSFSCGLACTCCLLSCPASPASLWNALAACCSAALCCMKSVWLPGDKQGLSSHCVQYIWQQALSKLFQELCVCQEEPCSASFVLLKGSKPIHLHSRLLVHICASISLASHNVNIVMSCWLTLIASVHQASAEFTDSQKRQLLLVRRHYYQQAGALASTRCKIAPWLQVHSTPSAPHALKFIFFPHHLRTCVYPLGGPCVHTLSSSLYALQNLMIVLAYKIKSKCA